MNRGPQSEDEGEKRNDGIDVLDHGGMVKTFRESSEFGKDEIRDEGVDLHVQRERRWRGESKDRWIPVGDGNEVGYDPARVEHRVVPGRLGVQVLHYPTEIALYSSRP